MQEKNVSNSNFVIEDGVLLSYTGTESIVKIPSDVIKIGVGAFENAEISEIVFSSNTLQSIERDAFKRCNNLECVELPEGLINIGEKAFYACSKLRCVYVPYSVLVIEEDAFDLCSSDLFIIGKKNSEAEEFATEKHLGFRTDKTKALAAFKSASKKTKELETKTFNVYGESITCSNSLPLYIKVINHYDKIKKKMVEDIMSCLPQDIMSDVEGSFQQIIDKPIDQSLKILEKEGIVIERSHALLAVSSNYVEVCNSIGVVLKSINVIRETISQNIDDKTVDLKYEIDRKVTGLSYGIIGDRLDLLAYSLDDARERAYQRGRATAIADSELKKYKSNQWNEGDRIYKNHLKEQSVTIEEHVSNYIKTLMDWALSTLSSSGLLDLDAMGSLDYKKSMKLLNSADQQGKDECAILALSIKKYPYNITAIARMFAKKYDSQDLKDLVNFLDISKDVKTSIKAEREKYISHIVNIISSMPSLQSALDFYSQTKNNLDKDERKILLEKITNKVSTQVSELLSNSNSNDISTPQAYVEEHLTDIINAQEWNFLVNEGVRPINSTTSIPSNAISTYSALLSYIISDFDSKQNAKKLKLAEAKEKLKSAKSIAEYDEVKKLLTTLDGYRDSRKIIAEIEKTILNLQYDAIVSKLGDSKKRESLLAAKAELEKIENHEPSKNKIAEIDLALKKDTKKKVSVGLVCSAIFITIIVVLNTVIIPNSNYNDAIALINDGKYTEAIAALESLNGYKDSLQKIEEIHSSGKLQARKLAEEGKYQEAADISNKYGLTEDAEHYSKISNGEYWRLCEHFDFKEIVLPDNITSIGESAFLNCSNLTKITIPNNVTSIGESAFSGCSSLTNITIPNNVTNIGKSAFSGCSSLTNITIPNNVTSISKSTFADCSSLTNIDIPNSIEVIDEAAFSGCSSLTKITIPESVTKISKDVLNGCNNLQELTIPFTGLSVDSIEHKAHVGYIFGYDYDSGLYSQTGHFYTTSGNGYSTKYNCYTYNIPKSLKNVIITNSKTIKAFAFQNCNTLEGVELYDGTTTIESNAFKGCSNLERLVLPDSINSLDLEMFTTLSKLNYTEYDNAYYFGSSNNLYMFLVKAKDSGITTCTIHPNTKFIVDNAFLDCSNLKNILFPTGLICIGHSAFEGCISITEVVIPDSVTTLGCAAFQDCAALRSVKIGHRVTSIGTSTFDGCENISTLIIPASVTEIGGWAFDFAGRDQLSYVYYGGTSQQWSNIVIDTWGAVDSIFAGEYMRPSPLYYYSETKPTTSGKYWHYVEGVPTIW